MRKRQRIARFVAKKRRDRQAALERAHSAAIATILYTREERLVLPTPRPLTREEWEGLLDEFYRDIPRRPPPPPFKIYSPRLHRLLIGPSS